jgi:hypothetical protein
MENIHMLKAHFVLPRQTQMLLEYRGLIPGQG